MKENVSGCFFSKHSVYIIGVHKRDRQTDGQTDMHKEDLPMHNHALQSKLVQFHFTSHQSLHGRRVSQ